MLAICCSTDSDLATATIEPVAMARVEEKHKWHKFEMNYTIVVYVLWCKDASSFTYRVEIRKALKSLHYDDTILKERAESIERARACNSPQEQCGIPAVLLKTFQTQTQLPKESIVIELPRHYYYHYAPQLYRQRLQPRYRMFIGLEHKLTADDVNKKHCMEFKSTTITVQNLCKVFQAEGGMKEEEELLFRNHARSRTCCFCYWEMKR